MTVSPPATSTPPAESSSVLPESIGWLFIERYYEVYTKSINNLFKLYDKNASISHDKFPNSESPEQKVLYQAKGTEAIKSHFQGVESSPEVQNRIVITSADFQLSFEKNILIVVFGEWAKGDSPYYQFSQTFLLSPSKEKVYDVGNDVLKYIEVGKYDESKINQTYVESVKPESEKPVAEATPVSNGSKQAKQESKDTETEVKSVPAEKSEKAGKAEPKAEPKAEKSEPKSEKSEKSEPKVEPKAEPKTEPKDESSEAKDEEPVEPRDKSSDVNDLDKDADTTEFKPSDEGDFTKESAKYSAPLSWAALAAKEPPKSSTGQTATVASPGAAKAAPAPAPIVKKSTPPQKVSPAPSTNPTARTTPNGKYKKEDWYPIYVRDVEVDDEELKDALAKNFGQLKFFRRNNRVALIDFKTKQDQEAALKAKTLKIGENVISLEPREHRNNNSKPDFKRGRDKKQNTNKKNRSSSRN
ncbi:hypothetical protein QCA50_017468 [Cerrena zonata]|uniref:NTF2 domain-containing protein n=1 Tax=Cerrena zonata TaxID=2478898 RepID=A0AAW0FKL7_9APHY